ncbi:hypothetical protein [Rurimicrobium arvi]|uniref:Uncharacterized protein n=1 Tax=Rurimicrobium arvi TaxID=2049916 RepID=A0ABP8MN55_9BACT
MKKLLLQIAGLCVLPMMSIATPNHYKGDYLGLIGELTYIQESSEMHARQILNDGSASPELKSRTLEAYNTVKQLDDQLLNQLETDSRIHNSVCNYKKLDKMLTCHTMKEVKRDFNNPRHHYCNAKLEAYVYNLVLLHKAHKELMQTGNEMEWNNAYDSWKGFAGQDHKRSFHYGDCKVENMANELDQTRLCPVSKLMKKPEPRKEQTIILKQVCDKDMPAPLPPHAMRTVKKHRHTGKKCSCGNR